MTDNVLNINISLETAKCCRMDHPGSLIILGNPQDAIENYQARLKGPLEQGGGQSEGVFQSECFIRDATA